MHRADDHRRDKRLLVAVAHYQHGDIGIRWPRRVMSVGTHTRTIRHSQTDPCRSSVLVRLCRRFYYAVLETLDVPWIGCRDGWVCLAAEYVHSHRPGVCVRCRDHHVRGGNTDLPGDTISDAFGRLAANEDHVVGNEQQGCFSVGKIHSSAAKRVVHSGAVPPDVWIAE